MTACLDLGFRALQPNREAEARSCNHEHGQADAERPLTLGMQPQYGAVQPQGRAPGGPARPTGRTLALVLAAVALAACVAGLGARGAVVPAARAQLVFAAGVPQGQTQLVAVLQPEGPATGELARKNRRTLALEAYLNTVCVCAAPMLCVCARGEALDAYSPEYMRLCACAHAPCVHTCAGDGGRRESRRRGPRGSGCGPPGPPVRSPAASCPRPVPSLPSSLAPGYLGAAVLWACAHLTTPFIRSARRRSALGQDAAETEMEAATEDPFPSAEAAFSPEHQAELEAEVERLRTENAALKQGSARTQVKSPLYPYQNSHFGYPWGYDKNNGWHQEIGA